MRMNTFFIVPKLSSEFYRRINARQDRSRCILAAAGCRQCSYSRNCSIMQDNAGAPRRWLCRKLAAAPWAGTGSADLQHSAGEHCHGNCVSLEYWYFVRTLRSAGYIGRTTHNMYRVMESRRLCLHLYMCLE